MALTFFEELLNSEYKEVIINNKSKKVEKNKVAFATLFTMQKCLLGK